MTLIDKDALVKQFDGNIEYFTADETIEMIENAPVIDAVEVVHAHWTRVDDWTDECSVCGDWHENDVNDRTPYCAKCGANMDGHKKDVMADCKYKDTETGWCKLHSDWSEPMPYIEYCVDAPCPDEEQETTQ